MDSFMTCIVVCW